MDSWDRLHLSVITVARQSDFLKNTLPIATSVLDSVSYSTDLDRILIKTTQPEAVFHALLLSEGPKTLMIIHTVKAPLMGMQCWQSHDISLTRLDLGKTL